MSLLFLIFSTVLFALCFSWNRTVLLRNAAIVLLLGGFAVGGYFALGYPQAYKLKPLLTQINEDPASVDYDEVHALLDQHLFWHADDALARTFQARLYFASQDYSLAAQAFAKAYGLLPNDGDLMVEYATTLYLTGDNPDVLAQLIRDLINMDNMPYSAHSLLANIAMDQGEIELAKTHWTALLRFIPRDSAEARQIRILLHNSSLRAP